MIWPTSLGTWPCRGEFFCGDLIKATYEASSRVLGVEWSFNSLVNDDGRIKVHHWFGFLVYGFEFKFKLG